MYKPINTEKKFLFFVPKLEKTSKVFLVEKILKIFSGFHKKTQGIFDIK